MQKDLNLVVKGAALMTAGIIASKILGLIFQIILVNILTPAELGLFFLAMGIIVIFVMLASFGMTDSLARFVAFYLEKKDLPRVKGTIGSTIKIHAILSIFGCIFVFFASDWIATAIFGKPELGILLKMLSVTVPISTIASDFLMAMDGFKQIKYKVYIRKVIQIITKIIVLIGLSLVGLSLLAAIFTVIIAEAIAFVFGFFFLEKNVFPIINSKIKAIHLEKEMILFSMPLFLTGIFASLMSNFDIIVLGFFAPAYNVGIYGVALTTANLGQTPLEALVVLAIPIATGYFALSKIEEFKNFYSTLSRWIFLLSFPLTVLLIIFAEPVQILFFKTTYASSALALSILLLGYFVFSIVGPTQQALISAGKTKLILANAVAVGLLSVILNSILAPFFAQPFPLFGLPANSEHVGTAIAIAVSNSFWGILALIELHSLFKIQPFTKTHIKVFFAGVIGIALALLIASTAMPYSIMLAMAEGRIPILIYLIATGTIFMLLYLPLLLVFRSFGNEDVQIMLAIERKTGIRIEFLRNFAKRFVK